MNCFIMKKIKYAVFFALLSLTVASCAKDKEIVYVNGSGDNSGGNPAASLSGTKWSMIVETDPYNGMIFGQIVRFYQSTCDFWSFKSYTDGRYEESVTVPSCSYTYSAPNGVIYARYSIEEGAPIEDHVFTFVINGNIMTMSNEYGNAEYTRQ